MARRRNPHSDMIGVLNARLADALALSLQARQAHWNVKGPSFQGLHELFDKVYAMASDHADLLAERVVQLGGTTNAVAAPVQSSLPAYPISAVMGREHAAAMTASLIAYSEGLQRAAEQADEIGDAATLDILSEVLRGADKHRWFVQAHLAGDMKFNGRLGRSMRNSDADLRALERRVIEQFGSGFVEPVAMQSYMAARARAGETGLPPLMVDLGRRALRSRRSWLALPGDDAAQGNLRALRESAGMPLLVNVDEMLKGYLETALWSSHDNSDPAGGDPLDRNYGIDDFAPESVVKAKADIELFALLADADMADTPADAFRHGHDFWLTSNRHGVGFSDRGYGEAGDRLTEVARTFGEISAVAGDDGMVYLE